MNGSPLLRFAGGRPPHYGRVALQYAVVAIYREGPQQEERHTSLGHVLVTVDDLAALIDILREHARPPDASSRDVRVEFVGGYFTAAEDLTRLSDEEIRSLRVTTPATQVVLNEFEAVCVGTEESSQAVYRLWARSRTRTRSSFRRLLRMPGLLLISFAVFLTWTRPALVYSMAPSFSLEPTSAVVALLLLAGATLGIMGERIGPTPPNSALIVPFSADEYRRTRASSLYPRWSLIVTMASVLVAIAAIVVSVLIAK